MDLRFFFTPTILSWFLLSLHFFTQWPFCSCLNTPVSREQATPWTALLFLEWPWAEALIMRPMFSSLRLLHCEINSCSSWEYRQTNPCYRKLNICPILLLQLVNHSLFGSHIVLLIHIGVFIRPKLLGLFLVLSTPSGYTSLCPH